MRGGFFPLRWLVLRFHTLCTYSDVRLLQHSMQQLQPCRNHIKWRRDIPELGGLHLARTHGAILPVGLLRNLPEEVPDGERELPSCSPHTGHSKVFQITWRKTVFLAGTKMGVSNITTLFGAASHVETNRGRSHDIRDPILCGIHMIQYICILLHVGAGRFSIAVVLLECKRGRER